jgi:hypothetical protein
MVERRSTQEARIASSYQIQEMLEELDFVLIHLCMRHYIWRSY